MPDQNTPEVGAEGDGLSLELKYKLYEKSVQNHEDDIEFVSEEYRRIKGREALTLREDFCGTGALACAWADKGEGHRAWGVDIDPEPMEHGKKRHHERLGEAARGRMRYIQGDVAEPRDFKTDVVVAFNFSYYVFKRRRDLVRYFERVREGLNSQGVFFVDIFGGTECFQELEEETEFKKHSYYWDCDSYNPLKNEAVYHIHFKTYKDGKRHERVFSYDWRHWTVAEVVEAMEDAGFAKVLTYWEEDDEDGEEGNGEFYVSDKEENCESWVAYIVGLKEEGDTVH